MLPEVLALATAAWLLLAVFVGLPLLSLLVVVVFAVTADFRFVEVKVRGGGMRGAIAAALARVLVRDTETIQIPLAVVIEKTGLFGPNTPLFGGATVRDLECRVYMDDEHVSTITEASSTRIDSFQRRVELPVNVDIHLPGGVIAAYRDYRRKKRAAAEVRLHVRGHVIVRHWWMNREVPVRVTKHLVVGDPVPRLAAVRWRAASPHGEVQEVVPGLSERGWGYGRLSVRLANGYRDEELRGTVTIELRATRRLWRDRLVARYEVAGVRVRPGRRRTLRFFVRLDRAAPPGADGALDTVDAALPAPVRPPRPNRTLRFTEGEPLDGDDATAVCAVAARVLWDGEALAPDEVLVAGVPGAETAPLHVAPAPRGERAKTRLVARLERLEGRAAPDRSAAGARRP